MPSPIYQLILTLGCQRCGMYFIARINSGDRQPMFCNPCLGIFSKDV